MPPITPVPQVLPEHRRSEHLHPPPSPSARQGDPVMPPEGQGAVLVPPRLCRGPRLYFASG